MSIIGLDHVQLAAPPGCEDEARRFFGGLLGLEEIEKPLALRSRGGVWFSLGAQQLHVGVDSAFAPAHKAHPALRVLADELDIVAGRLSAAGVDVVWDDLVPHVRRFYVQDPWGNRLELIAGSQRIHGRGSGSVRASMSQLLEFAGQSLRNYPATIAAIPFLWDDRTQSGSLVPFLGIGGPLSVKIS